MITSRICGVCPTSHGTVAALTLDNAFGVTPPTTGTMMRNLVDGFYILQSGITATAPINLYVDSASGECAMYMITVDP